MSTVARAGYVDRDRARRLRRPLGVAAAVSLATLALRVHDPHQSGSWGFCPFKAVTGWDCPLCGGLRATNDLGHGQLVEAAHSNLLFVASLPVLVGLWAWWVQVGWTGRRPSIPERTTGPVLIGLAVLAVAFAVFRNTPWGADWHVS